MAISTSRGGKGSLLCGSHRPNFSAIIQAARPTHSRGSSPSRAYRAMNAGPTFSGSRRPSLIAHAPAQSVGGAAAGATSAREIHTSLVPTCSHFSDGIGEQRRRSKSAGFPLMKGCCSHCSHVPDIKRSHRNVICCREIIPPENQPIGRHQSTSPGGTGSGREGPREPALPRREPRSGLPTGCPLITYHRPVLLKIRRPKKKSLNERASGRTLIPP